MSEHRWGFLFYPSFSSIGLLVELPPARQRIRTLQK
jgi:hypothetical protein